MGRKTSQFEVDALAAQRTEVLDAMGLLMPKLRPDAVKVGIFTGERALEVVAVVVGDTHPYPLEEVEYYLGELGVKVDMPKPDTATENPILV